MGETYLDELVLQRPDGKEYLLRFSQDSVEVFYQEREISGFLRRCFAPQEGETVESLEKRLAEASAEREKLLEEECFSPVPEQYVQEFEEEFNVSIRDIAVTHNAAGKRLIQGAKALFEGKEGEVRVLNLAGAPDQPVVWHELIHAVMADNPTMMEFSSEPLDKSNRFYSMADILYLPLPYSPYDRRFAVVEAAPAALLDDRENVLSSSLAPFTNGMWASVGQVLASAVLTRVSRRAGDYVAHFWLGSGITRMPRVAYTTLKSIVMYRGVSEMKKRLGKKETLKLLTFADDAMVARIADYIKQEDIRF